MDGVNDMAEDYRRLFILRHLGAPRQACRLRRFPMTRRLRVITILCLSVGLLALGSPVRAQAPATQTGSQFYLAYVKAFDAAKKIEELLPFMSAERKKQIEATPAAERA